jgi:hypothetical protein
MKKVLVLLGGIGLAIAMITRLPKKEENETNLGGIKIKYKEVDFLDMEYVKDFFSKRYKKVIEKNSKAIPVILKLDLKEEYFYVFTFYDEGAGNIIEKYTRIINSNAISQDFKDAFGDKEMLVLT